ncbi:cytochrome c oxidase subunit II [Ovoidimarina sediminis]|uniref:cytochrome c oxidase subunit II n=1 Tax=Ovoidimarina sediminis TaxID=3079856 RepID=UPI002906F3F7|nr:cytochrome c oxidase subunit II [Rhodophyticola sp. MJ-SS7]MDU8942921.1 cytochrome c oxidase subunit II [Rhodophyticola sp. MJ-SS7]
MRLRTTFTALGAFFVSLFTAFAAFAQVTVEGLPTIGKPEPSGTGFQTPATGLMEDIIWLDTFLLVLITIITLFVLALLITVILRYNTKSNPTPATFTHNTPIEVTWTLVPVLILVVIGAVSLPVLFDQQEIPEGEVTIKVTGYQWYWGYEYVDAGVEGVEPASISFDSFMLERDLLADYGYNEDEYLLATDQPVVIPTGKVVVMQVTAADVIHSWTIPAFGVKQDGVPGRLAELWFEVEPGMEGVYFGQCSELCGKDHAYMPITVKAVTPEQYEEWLGRASEEFAGKPLPVQVAAAE